MRTEADPTERIKTTSKKAIRDSALVKPLLMRSHKGSSQKAWRLPSGLATRSCCQDWRGKARSEGLATPVWACDTHVA